MIADVYTVLWKEIKELFFQRGRFRAGMTGMLFFTAVFGIFLPLQTGKSWVESPIGLIYWSWVPFLLVSSVIADSFAGERERHTLETLLACRLPDLAILTGKLAASILYGWGSTMACILLGLITLNIAYGDGHLLLYPWKIMLGITVLSFLVASLAAGLGVLVSLRSATVRQAQQTFSIAFFVLFIPMFLLPMLPDGWKSKFIQVFSHTNLETIVVLIVGALLVIDGLLFLLAAARFQRDKLILE